MIDLTIRYCDDKLKSLRAQHVNGPHRRSETAIGHETARFLVDRLQTWHYTNWSRGQERRAMRVLDLGSGFSSSVLRWWSGTTHTDVDIWTTDTSWRWLGQALYELETQRLDTRHVLHHDVFMALPASIKGVFDLIFFDLADTPLRCASAPAIQQLRHPKGIVVLDDWHMAHYRTDAAPRWSDYHVIVHDEATRDRHGRYVAECAWPGDEWEPYVAPTEALP